MLAPKAKVDITLNWLDRTLGNYSYSCINELSFQEGIATVLGLSKIDFVREYQLNHHDRIDFYLPAFSLGIEVKIDGSALAVSRQLGRYCAHEKISGVLLATCLRHAGIPKTLSNKPIHVWRLFGALL